MGRAPDVGEDRQAATGLPQGRARREHARLSRPRHRQSHRGLHEVHRRRHVRQGRPGHDGRGRRELGRDRAEENLRGLSMTTRRITRRTFVKAAATAAAVTAAGRAPAFAQGTRLHILRWVAFIPACDVELKKQAADASKLLGAEVQFEFINANDLQSRITASVQSQSGPDIIHMLHNWPHLYENALLDVSDLADWQGKDQGGFYPQSEAYAKVGGKFLALPHTIVPGLIAYRKSWFNEIGVTTFPKTYEELRQVATKLKKAGHPYG